MVKEKAAILKDCNIRTHYNKDFAAKLRHSLNEFDSDTHKKVRVEARKCKVCFYLRGTRISGQAFTTTLCQSCGVSMTFPTTDVDFYCLPCSKELLLCVDCGGDINLRSRKKL
jgi:hypothetical protein